MDDEPAICRLLSRLLETAGHEVATAGSGTAAVDLVRRAGGAVDLVIVDYLIQGMDGVATIASLHALNPLLPTLLVSGIDDARVIRAAMAAGGWGVLRKPFRNRDMLESVDRIVRRRAALVAEGVDGAT